MKTVEIDPRTTDVNEQRLLSYLAAKPLGKVYGENSSATFYAEVMLYLRSPYGRLFTLSDESDVYAYALVIEKCDKNNLGSPYLHILSVPEKYQRKGYGSKILSELISNFITEEDLTIETHKDTAKFFEKHGFFVKDGSDRFELEMMHRGPNPIREQFYKYEDTDTSRAVISDFRADYFSLDKHLSQ